MDADEAAAGFHVLLEGVALGLIVKGLIVAVGEDQRVVLFQVFGGEDGGIVGRVQGEAGLGAHLPDGGGAGCDVVVDVAFAIGAAGSDGERNEEQGDQVFHVDLPTL